MRPDVDPEERERDRNEPHASSAAASASERTGPTHVSSCSSRSSHSRIVRVRNSASSSGSSGSNARSGEIRPVEQLAEALPELRLERRDRQVAAVGGLVDPVAGDAAREQALDGVAGEPVCDELVRAVRHRDRESAALPGLRA